jgi:hypothetical protein
LFFELLEFRDASLPGFELGSRGIRIESSSGVSSCSRELREMAVKGDREEMTRKELDLCKEDFMCAAVTVRLLLIRCHNATSED